VPTQRDKRRPGARTRAAPWVAPPCTVNFADRKRLIYEATPNAIGVPAPAVILISAHDEHDFAAADEVSAVTDSAVPQWERSCRQALLLRNALLLPTARTHPRSTSRPQRRSRHSAEPKSLRRSLHSHAFTTAAVFESPKSGDATSHG
jgi:hypothetical protein